MRHPRRHLPRRLGIALLLLAAVAYGEPITPLEAVHLAEGHALGLAVAQATLGEIDGSPVYQVAGRVGETPYQVVVDASVARVLEVRRAGEQVYAWGGVTVVAHRGALRWAPENTICAFEKAIELGAHLIEIDVRQTKDGHLVLMHSSRVDHTTDGTGRVADLTLARIKKLDAGSWFAAEFAGEHVPTLDEALDAMAGRALPDIDFKEGDAEKLVAVLRQHGLLGKVTVFCRHWQLLHDVLDLTSAVYARPSSHGGRLGLAKVIDEFDPPIININWPVVTEEFIRDVHMAGKKAFVNVLGAQENEYALAAAVDAGADYIQCDRLDVLVPLLKRRGIYAPVPEAAASR